MNLATGLVAAILLWPNGAPGAKGDLPNDKPTMTVHLPDSAKATGAAVVICPGGGYGGLCLSYEGHDVAKWFNSFGVAGIVLEYRHRGKGYAHPAPLQDAQRAIRTVRARAGEWKINPDRIGIMGFSAGGHLASSAGTHFDKGNASSDDPIERVSCRPDFLILCYPVIAFGEPFTHYGSQENLLGKDADAALVRSMSSEKQVTKDTPPAFLFHTTDDQGVPVENSVQFYMAMRKAGVPVEAHFYAHGPHGVGMAPTDPSLSTWTKCCERWMRARGFLGDAKKK
jgi:acetyl esterase/lipase